MQIIRIFLFVFLIAYTAYTSTNFVRATNSSENTSSSNCDPNIKKNANYSSCCCEPNSVFFVDCNSCNCSKDGTYANCSTNKCTCGQEENCDPECYAVNNTANNSDDNTSNDDMTGNVCYNATTNTTASCCVPGSTYHNYRKNWETCICNDKGSSACCTDQPCPTRPEQTLAQKII